MWRDNKDCQTLKVTYEQIDKIENQLYSNMYKIKSVLQEGTNV